MGRGLYIDSARDWCTLAKVAAGMGDSDQYLPYAFFMLNQAVECAIWHVYDVRGRAHII